ncbi:hypothetical protein Dimus_027486 [Dionaea muscipula]
MAHQVKDVTSMIDGLFREARDLGIKATKLVAATGIDRSFGAYLSFVAIVGIPGIGKTTLARWIYENEAIIESFLERILIHVSYDFNINKILNQIIEIFTKSNPDLSSTEALTKKLQDQIGGTKYLLVLDDVWNTAEEM